MPVQRAAWFAIFVLCLAPPLASADGVLPGLQGPDYPGTPTSAGVYPSATPTSYPPMAAPATGYPSSGVPAASYQAGALPAPPVAAVPPPQPGGVPVSAPVIPSVPPPTASPVISPPSALVPSTPSTPVYTPQLSPSPLLVTPSPTPVRPDIEFQLLQPPCRPKSDLYARVDYFTWKEFINSYEVLSETGPLVTIGYLREGVHTRLRAELFGGNVDYDGETMDGVPLDSQTGYFGGRFDFDFLGRWPAPAGFVELFAGLGTRAWERNLKGGWDADGRPVISYHENWWTIYLYGGLGLSRSISPTLELYGNARAGATVFTRQYVSLDEVDLQPRAGFYGAMEFGLRGKRLAMALRMEMMAFAESGSVAVWSDGDWWGIFQPESEMSTIGLSVAYTF